VCGSTLLEEHLEETQSGAQCIFCGAHLSGSGDDEGPEIPSDVGDTLRRARLVRHESLEDAARATCLQLRYLAALEGNHSLHEFPGRVYARYFLRDYAEYLGLDPSPLLRSFDAVHDAGIEPLVPARAPRGPRRRWGMAAAISAVLLTTAIAVPAFLQRADDRAAAGRVTPPASPAQVASTVHGSSGARQPPSTAHIGAVLTVTDRCWVSAIVDGQQRPSRTYTAGRTLRFQARHSLSLVLGNAGGAELSVNGKRVPTGAAGQPVHMAFVMRHGQVQRLD
jgi:cytoskeletal protein RodZ